VARHRPYPGGSAQANRDVHDAFHQLLAFWVWRYKLYKPEVMHSEGRKRSADSRLTAYNLPPRSQTIYTQLIHKARY